MLDMTMTYTLNILTLKAVEASFFQNELVRVFTLVEVIIHSYFSLTRAKNVDSLSMAAKIRPRKGGEGLSGRAKYSGWYCTATK